MKIDAEMALVPLQGSIKPVRSLSNRELVDYGNYRRNRYRLASIGNREGSLGNNNYNRLGCTQKNLFFLGENVDIYV